MASSPGVITAKRAIGADNTVAPLIVGNAIPAQAAMNVQTFAQSGLAGSSGQHGRAFGMSAGGPSILAAAISMGTGIAVAGVTNGASRSPSQARPATKCRTINWRFTPLDSHMACALQRGPPSRSGG